MRKISECPKDIDLETFYGGRKNKSFFIYIFHENYMKIFLEIIY